MVQTPDESNIDIQFILVRTFPVWSRSNLGLGVILRLTGCENQREEISLSEHDKYYYSSCLLIENKSR
jgi:hypothetical protein